MIDDVRLQNQCEVEAEIQPIDEVSVQDEDEIEVQSEVEDEDELKVQSKVEDEDELEVQSEVEEQVGVETETLVGHAVRVKDEHKVENKDDDKDPPAEAAEPQLVSSDTPRRKTTRTRPSVLVIIIIYAAVSISAIVSIITDAKRDSYDSVYLREEQYLERVASIHQAMYEHMMEQSTHRSHLRFSNPFIPPKDVISSPESSLHDETEGREIGYFFLEILLCVLWENRRMVLRWVWVAAYKMWKARRLRDIMGWTRCFLRPSVKQGHVRITWKCVSERRLTLFLFLESALDVNTNLNPDNRSVAMIYSRISRIRTATQFATWRCFSKTRLTTMEKAQSLSRRRLQVISPLPLMVARNPENHPIQHRPPRHHLLPANKITPERPQARD